ncbi:glutamine synthetase family protein [Candidatus Lucifugimonas marina]|jgi:glutamine synthetase|uniref:Glutamine synthetase n=1 Tax=Candidatus Lucifugimonas marina TaxID=3038979 RepID=A0AAJ5ZKA8_9CHLR|nr:glutamine synthetase [SAR202 cluster bacterium JH702]MDG0870079.1 glutamine synthetase [SAR202 cluster bacterium JH639]WFG36358.1 glutamine synthetase [SAR202 cluster bacterium JH545]WFG40291.1 glutamine synthetase [SAR202 cluster bacterium JH1073]
MTQTPENTRQRIDEEAIKYVLMSAREHDVKFIRLWFTDILGTLKGFAITIDELEGVLRNGASFDGASIEGLTRADESDMIAMPDPSTFQVLPWRPSKDAVARMFCDIETPTGDSSAADGRQILRRNLMRAADMGFTFYVAPEIEYYYDMGEAKEAERSNRSGYFDQTSVDGTGADLRRDTVLTLEKMGIPVKHSHHEVGDGQHEIDLRHTNALTMADSIITFKVIAKELAAPAGAYATFMPRPFGDRHGSGMHTHMSLFEGDNNAFFDAEDEKNLSETGKHFIAGLMRHAADICVVTNQWINSYKRLLPGLEAPIFASWSTQNFGDLVRVPSYRPGREESIRIEYRAPDAAANPYLLFSVLLAAGLDGIENKLPLPEPLDDDVFRMSDTELNERGVARLPRTLDEAIRLAENSELLEKALGSTVMSNFLANKRIEWQEFSNTVTDFELKRYRHL